MTRAIILCWEFFKTGLFAVGGGLATLPFLTQIQEKYGWFTAEELANMIAVSESTPGPIGVNMATYVGFGNIGVLGGVLATLSLVLPSLVIIMLIARALDAYQKNPLVQNAFSFLRPAVTGLIAAAGFSVLRTTLWRGGSFDWIAVALYAVFLALTQWKNTGKLHPAVYIAAGALVGILMQM